MKKLFNFIVEKWYLVFIFSLVLNCSAFLISDENLMGIYFIVDILILLLLLMSFGYHLQIKKWLKAFYIFLSSIAHSFISLWVLIALITIGIIKSCESREYDETISIVLNESDPICDTIKKNNDLELRNYLDIGFVKDSVFALHFEFGADLPLCVGIYKLDDGRILTVEKEGLIASIKKDSLMLESK